MKQYVARMRALLAAGLEGAGVPDRQVGFDQSGFFRLGQSGIEVAIERQSNKWRVREIHMIADIEEGGERAVGMTIAEGKLGDEVQIAKAAIMRMVEVRIDGGLDTVA